MKSARQPCLQGCKALISSFKFFDFVCIPMAEHDHPLTSGRHPADRVTIEEAGSFAAAARALGKVPSALSYSVRQLETALDVLLFDRSSRTAVLTPAGRELLSEGRRLLLEMDALASRVKRVASGWEGQLAPGRQRAHVPAHACSIWSRPSSISATTPDARHRPA
jgi:DNA-binding transcriptional LysR family regulator